MSVAAPSFALTVEVALFVVALLFTLAIAGIFLFAVVRHADRDSDGRRHPPDDSGEGDADAR